jgi:hypothetical protein
VVVDHADGVEIDAKVALVCAANRLERDQWRRPDEGLRRTLKIEFVIQLRD